MIWWLMVCVSMWQVTVDPAALFAQGAAWPAYLESVQQQRDTWARHAARPVPDALVNRLTVASTGLRLLVVAEDWCSDSVNTVPYIATLAARANVELRVVNAQLGKSVMEAHRTPDGRAATATVVLLRDGREVGAWVERPSALQGWMLGAGAALPPAERLQRKLSWYEWNRGDDTVAEIVTLAEKSAGGRRP